MVRKGVGLLLLAVLIGWAFGMTLAKKGFADPIPGWCPSGPVMGNADCDKCPQLIEGPCRIVKKIYRCNPDLPSPPCDNADLIACPGKVNELLDCSGADTETDCGYNHKVCKLK
jgi:hypothetical protein